MSQISDLSDDELRALLFEHGQKPGAITATTRRVYELKLESIIKKGGTAAKKGRRSLDTLRSTEKPKMEPRRSENMSRSNVPAFLNLSDYSDTESPDLSVTSEHQDTPAPPKNLVLSSRSPTRRKPIKTIEKDCRDPTLFSDTEDDRTTNKTKKAETKGRTREVVSIVVGVLVAIVSIGVAYFLLRGKPTSPIIAQQCQNLTFEMTLIECDRIYSELVRQKRELDLFSGEVSCGDKEGDLHIPAPYSLSERQLVFFLREDLNYSIFIRRDDAYIQLETDAELEGFNPVDTAFFYSTQTPHVTWYCYVSTVISNFAFYILAAAVILLVIQAAHKAYQWKRAKAKQETGQMYELIDQIIEELQRNYTKYLGDPINYVPYVAIPHARDRLLLPSERTAMKQTWDKAVQFIALHESRVRVEMRRVQSEDFPVWYWLEASKSCQPQPDSTSPDFLYPDLDSEMISS